MGLDLDLGDDFIFNANENENDENEAGSEEEEEDEDDAGEEGKGTAEALAGSLVAALEPERQAAFKMCKGILSDASDESILAALENNGWGAEQALNALLMQTG